MTPSVIAFICYLFGLAWRPLVVIGFLVQAGYLGYRGVSLGRLPLVGVHDTLSFLAASVVGFALVVHWARRQPSGFFMGTAGQAAFFTAFALMQKPHAMPLPPVLKTYWFELHVALSFFSYALFGIAAVLGAIYLINRDLESEKLQYKVIFTGYSMFSLSMVFGGVWAHLAWGTYWLWTPKELWTVLLWLFYSYYLHARLEPRWMGARAAWVGVIGYVVVLFTYLGVGMLMKSSHAF